VAGAWMMVLRGQGHADRAWVSTRSGSGGARDPDESDQKKMPQHALDSTRPSQACFANAPAPKHWIELAVHDHRCTPVKIRATFPLLSMQKSRASSAVPG
jgi:hypothetical protein